jgi:hypothetical protein
MSYDHSWITTHFGHCIDFHRSEPNKIDLRDIAWNLSGISADPAARFPDSYNGTYSLAQRACLIAKAMGRMDAKATLSGFWLFAFFSG